jgi:competence protein ComEC
MISSALAFFAGTLVLLVSPWEPAPPAIACAVLALVGSCVFRRYGVARGSFWACCGFLLAAYQAHQYLQLRWPTQAADERVRAEVIVASIPVTRGEDWLFDASVRIKAPHPRTETLNVRVISRDPAVRPHAGERWQLLLAMRPPLAALNPGAVDAGRLLFHDRIHAFGTVVGSRINQRLDGGHRPLTALRERIASHIHEKVIDRDAAALIAALAVGATGEMSREQWRVFSATGTSHLVAISGAHVTMFAIVMFAIARWIWSMIVWRWVAWPRETFAAFFGLAAATAYAALAGLSIPTQRTLIMLAAWILARTTSRYSSPLQPLATALLAVLLIDPFAPLTAGFWLSFGAMGAIIFVSETRIAPRGKSHEAVVVQLSVAAVLVPLTLACFGSISLTGPVVNAIAIPYIGWVLVPVILLALTLMPVWSAGSDGILSLAEWLHNLAWTSLAAAADSPFSLAYASPPIWWYVLAAMGVAVLLLPWPWRMRLAAAVCLVPLAAAHSGAPLPGGIDLTALDVGEGTAIVIQTARHTLVYGTGESYGTAGNRVENALLPFLRSRGIREIDALIVERLTPVTGAGVIALFAAMPVKRTFIGGDAIADLNGAELCGTHQSWEWDGVRFRIAESCNLLIATARGQVELTRAAALLTDAAGTHWSIVSGRAASARQRLAGIRVLATAETGAVRFVINPKLGATAPVGLRQARQAIWR